MKRIIHETDIEKAELAIAAEAAFEKLASIVEDYGDWILKTYMPLIDEIRKTIGDKTAEKLTTRTKDEINMSFENLNKMKKTFLNAIKILERIIRGEKVEFEEKPKSSSDIDILRMKSDENSGLKEMNCQCPTSLSAKINIKDELQKRTKGEIHKMNEMKKDIYEKWNVKGPVVDPKDVGKWKDYSIKELCALWKKLRNKEHKTPEDKEKIAQIVFAIRAKHYGARNKWGPAKNVCGLKESTNLTEKWGKEVKINPSEKGKWSKYTVYQLCKKYKALKNKENKTEKEKGMLRELAFAIRAKMGWPKGKGPLSICNIKVEE